MGLIGDLREKRQIVAAIERAGPFADRELGAALAPFSPAALAAFASSKAPWPARRAALRGLAGRVDEPVAARLLEIALDEGEVEELRCQAIELLAGEGRAEIVLPALCRVRASLAAMPKPPYRLGDVVDAASARLGDLGAALPALRLRYDAWSHRRRLGDEALRALEAARGVEAVARAFGAPDASVASLEALALRHGEPCVRRWAVDVAPPASPFLVSALSDASWVVAEGAHDALLAAPEADEPAIAALARDAEAAPLARARATLVLLRRGRRELAAELWAAFACGRIALPGVPESVRRTVLHAYLPGERGTDPRWLLEGELDRGLDLALERDGGPDEPAERIVEAAREALSAAGFAPGEPVPIGAVRQQGGGTYVHLAAGGHTLQVCELGRFVACDDPAPAPLRGALERAGFLFVEGALAARVFEGLGVYFFGARGALCVYDLLFYWQD